MAASMAAAMLATVAPAPAGAAAFTMKRGLNLDIWTTWPGEAEWGDPAVLLPYPQWRQFLDDADLAALKAAGFDFLRMPVDPAPFLSDRTAAFRDELYASVLASARMVNRAGLKVVVDMHLIPAGSSAEIGMERVMERPEAFDAYVEAVAKMAATLAGEDPARTAFEPINEPLADCDGTDLWPQRLERLHAAARAAAPRLTLVLSGSCYASAAALSRIEPGAIADDNLIWTFHSYDPFLLTHQGATWAGDFIRYVTGLPYPLNAVPRAELEAALAAVRDKIAAEAPWARRRGMLAYLDEQVAEIDGDARLLEAMDAPFRTVEAWASRNGIAPQAILLGEFGMIRQEYGNAHVVPAPYRAAYVRDMVARAEAHGFAWALWGYGGAFGVIESFEGDKAEPDVLDMVRSLPGKR